MFSDLKLETKEEYRIQAKILRNSLDMTFISNAICRQIGSLEVYQKAEVIAGFYPFGNEIDLRQLYQDFSKQWFLPKVMDETTMEFYFYKDLSKLSKNKFGIHEPVCDKKLNPEKIDVIIVPALMVDKKGHRLGYGRGYYDRFLSKLPSSCVKIVPIPEELTIQEFPADEFDIPIDLAITQDRIYDFKKFGY